jgi:predicted membrane GTPase involved in stress response
MAQPSHVDHGNTGLVKELTAGSETVFDARPYKRMVSLTSDLRRVAKARR